MSKIRKLDSKHFAVELGKKTVYIREHNGMWKSREAYTNREINLGSSKSPLGIAIFKWNKK